MVRILVHSVWVPALALVEPIESTGRLDEPRIPTTEVLLRHLEGGVHKQALDYPGRHAEIREFRPKGVAEIVKAKPGQASPRTNSVPRPLGDAATERSPARPSKQGPGLHT